MERLTEKRPEEFRLKELKGALCNDYCEEQSCSTCEDCAIYKAIQKLAYYEDMEDQGKLIVLPCNHGDLVYFIKSKFSYAKNPIMGRVFEVKVINDRSIAYTAVTPSIDRRFLSNDIGKTVFLTEQEAYEALEAMKNKSEKY